MFAAGPCFQHPLRPARCASSRQQCRACLATPILVLSHIPFSSACVFFDGDNENAKTGRYPCVDALDARRLKDLFAKHRNVRVCLSGHIPWWTAWISTA